METKNTNEKLPQKPSSGTTTSSPESYCLVWLRKLAAAYGQSVAGVRQTIYLEALAPFTEAQIEEAVTVAIARTKFFPTVAELLEYIHEATVVRHREHAKRQNQKL